MSVRISDEVIQDLGWALSPMISFCLYKRHKKTDTQRLCEKTEAEIGVTGPQAKECVVTRTWER
jgi:hypothetical protein